MLKFLFGTLVLAAAAGCSKNSADPEEIAGIFSRHSYAETAPAAVREAFAAGKPGPLRALDAYAAVLGPDLRPEHDYPGRLKAGAGLALWKTDGGLEVVKVFPGSSAAAAGLAAGDVIKKLDGKAVAGMPSAAVFAAFYGQRGGAVAFEGEKGKGGALAGSFRRESGAAPLVWGFMIPGGKTGYLRLGSFSEKTPESVRKELEGLAAAGAGGVVIDLRHNYGGPLDALAGTLALFAPGPQLLFKAVSRRPGYNRDFYARKTGPFSGLKLVLLTNSATMSRAEVFAASLREAGRAVTAGGQTAGNVSVTKTFRLKRGGALRLTVARLVTPSGTDLDGAGLAPDLPVYDPLDGDYAFSSDFPPPVASADPVLAAALKRCQAPF